MQILASFQIVRIAIAIILDKLQFGLTSTLYIIIYLCTSYWGIKKNEYTLDLISTVSSSSSNMGFQVTKSIFSSLKL